jgi:hypothetical protein
MDIKYQLIEDFSGSYITIFSSLFIFILLLILSLRFFYPKRYLLNIYKPNVYIFEYEAKQKNYFSFYAITANLVNYLILFFITYVYTLHLTSGKISMHTIINLILMIIITLIYKLIIDFFFLIIIKKTNLFSSLRFIRTSFENHVYFFIFFIAFFMMFYRFDNYYLLIVNSFILLLYLIYSLTNFYVSLTKHIHLKNSKIILYLCISEILPIIFIIYWLSFQII